MVHRLRGPGKRGKKGAAAARMDDALIMHTASQVLNN